MILSFNHKINQSGDTNQERVWSQAFFIKGFMQNYLDITRVDMSLNTKIKIIGFID